MKININEICDKISILKNLDKCKEIFGASKHEYKFNPCKTEDEILAFEQINNISLPGEYRSFLLNVGNGGMGPSYGLLRLESYSAERSHKSGLPDSFLHTPFTPNNPHVETKSDDETENSMDYSLETMGTISICHHGCGIYSLLVVSGEDKGSVWIDDRRNDGGLMRESGSFFEWYYNWLQNSISYMKAKNALIDVMSANAYTCKIKNIVGKGRARGFSVSFCEIDEPGKLYYYESDEFLDKGEKTKKLRKNDEIIISLIITDFCLVEYSVTCFKHGFIQPNKDAADAVDIGVMRTNAEVILSADIKDIFYDRINYTHYYMCALKNSAINIFIESRAALDLKIGQTVNARGILSAQIHQRNSMTSKSIINFFEKKIGKRK
ncbi:MAG: SMI1/KNR4 family protein [Campylobacteraceae bacterium]|nr:SMI1/KNR4 family protein [Campylobacteraceae bacterium]